MEPLPSKSALVRIGKALAAGTETEAQLDQLDVLLGRCDEVKAEAVDRLIRLFGYADLMSGGGLSVRGRTKTLATLREKLLRMGGHQLPVIRDLAGVTIVGDMTLVEPDAILELAAAVLGASQDEIKLIDRRSQPIRGYRALHGEIVVDGVRVEIQVRSILQHEWAEAYEGLADKLGRELRYPQKKHDPSAPSTVLRVTDIMNELSDFIALIEEGAPMDESAGDGALVQAARQAGPGVVPTALVERFEEAGRRQKANEAARSATAATIRHYVRQRLSTIEVALADHMGRQAP